MKPPVFDYIVPENLEAALFELGDAGWDGKLLAGGQSLVPMMNYRLVQPSVLIDLNPLEELDYIEDHTGDVLRVGSMVRLHRLERDPLVQARVPLLAEALPFIAHVQIRTRGTLGGSLAHADPAAELPVVALATGARLKLRSADAERWLDADEFILGMFTTALEPEEILVEIEFPKSTPGTGWSFVEFARRPGDYALAGVAAKISLDADQICRQATLIYLNCGDGPVAANEAGALLVGERYSDDLALEAGRIAAENEISPLGNVHASPAYQQHLAQVLTRHALKTAFERANPSEISGS